MAAIENSKREIITHSGTFHLDEVMATAMLAELELWNGILTRTRDLQLIESKRGLAYIIDVGQVYEPERLSYDHHQESFRSYFNDKALEKGIKMSSCGLIYKTYGKLFFPNLSEEEIEKRWYSFYRAFVLEIDAHDNGVPPEPLGLKPLYQKNLTLGAMVSKLNLPNPPPNSEEQDQQFLEGVELCRRVLRLFVGTFNKARDEEEENFSLLKEDPPECIVVKDGNGQEKVVVVLRTKLKTSYYTNLVKRYFKYLHEKEEAYMHPEVFNDSWLFTIRLEYEKDGSISKYRIDTVKIEGQLFGFRAGILAQHLAKNLIGDDLIFVHNNRFCGATRTYDAAVKLTSASVKAHYSASNRAEGWCTLI